MPISVPQERDIESGLPMESTSHNIEQRQSNYCNKVCQALSIVGAGVALGLVVYGVYYIAMAIKNLVDNPPSFNITLPNINTTQPDIGNDSYNNSASYTR